MSGFQPYRREAAELTAKMTINEKAGLVSGFVCLGWGILSDLRAWHRI